MANAFIEFFKEPPAKPVTMNQEEVKRHTLITDGEYFIQVLLPMLYFIFAEKILQWHFRQWVKL